MSEPWHFPRPELAQNYLTALETGIFPSLALFGPRRIGKTQFILNDLRPLAEAQGYETFVIDFWADEKSPEDCITLGIKAGLRELSIRKNIKALSLMNVNAGMGALSVTAKQDLSGMNAAFDLLASIYDNDKTTKVILFLDEIQHIGTNSSFEGAARSLRTFIDKNKSWVKVIMTGSSQDGLHRLFNKKQSAFYRSSTQSDFPLLGSEFAVHTMREYLKRVNREETPEMLNEWIRAYKKLNDSPLRMLGTAKHLIDYNEQDVMRAAEAYLNEENKFGSDLENRWEALSDTDAALLMIVADRIFNGVSVSLYSTETFDQLAKSGGIDKVTKSTVQNSTARLRKNGWLVSRERGSLAFESLEDYEFILGLIGVGQKDKKG